MRQPAPSRLLFIRKRIKQHEVDIGWESEELRHIDWRLSDAVFETCRNSRKLFHNIKVLNVATVDALGVIISIRGVSFHGKDYHIGVGSNVVCSAVSGNAKASISGTDDRQFPRFFMFV